MKLPPLQDSPFASLGSRLQRAFAGVPNQSALRLNADDERDTTVFAFEEDSIPLEDLDHRHYHRRQPSYQYTHLPSWSWYSDRFARSGDKMKFG